MSVFSSKNAADTVQTFTYERSTVTAGIVHFGLGNFHRAHQAVYVDDLLHKGETHWGITGVSLRSPTIRDALIPQDGLYTLAILGAAKQYRIIGAIKDVLVAPAAPQDVIARTADPSTQLVTSTITEKGYYLSSGEIDYTHPDLQAETRSLGTPKTIYGFLARAIMERAAQQRTNMAPSEQSKILNLTIMCCDNISKGGRHLKAGVTHLLTLHNPQALVWAESHVSFISSMVDRVCPATDDALRAAVRADTGQADAAPVSAEPFSQWIIEDDFAGKRPGFDRVGAVFVSDIEPYEQMKLRYLNAAHSLISTFGYLYGDSFVHEALEREDLFTFTRKALYENILPHAAVPHGYDASDYIESVIKRFQNNRLPYANLQVGTDSSQKIQQRWFPTLQLAINNGGDTRYFEFMLGAWAAFIQSAVKANVLNDPMLGHFKQVKSKDARQRVTDYLNIANADAFSFYKNESFMEAVTHHAAAIARDGINAALTDFLKDK